MFSSIDDLKINTNDYIELYKKNFERLVHQKERNRTHQIDQIISEILDKKIFKMEGDEVFQENVKNSIRSLLNVKPGRLLIKELTRLVRLSRIENPDDSILIKNGKTAFRHSDSWIDMNFNPNDDDNYNALSESNTAVCSKPKEITLGHELIHEFHHRDQELQVEVKYYKEGRGKIRGLPIPEHYKDIEIYPDPKIDSYTFQAWETQLIFKNCSNLEEEKTILGVNVPNFLKNKTIKKIDVLSENALLCAFNLLPRLDHQDPKKSPTQENISTSNTLSSYYSWLASQLEERNLKVATKLLRD